MGIFLFASLFIIEEDSLEILFKEIFDLNFIMIRSDKDLWIENPSQFLRNISQETCWKL